MNKIGNKDGKEIHYSVGAIISREINGKKQYLMIDRRQIPYGWACIAGHIDEGDDSEIALIREVKEEANLKVTKSEKVIENEYIEWNKCKTGQPHEWDVYQVDVEGELQIDEREAKTWAWISVEEMRNRTLEPVWKYFFEKLKIL